MSDSPDRLEPEMILCSVETLDPAEVASVRGLIQHLKPDNPVRVAAETLLEQHQVPKQSIPLILSCLRRPAPYHWRQQRVAAWILGRLEWHSEKAVVVECLQNLAQRHWHQSSSWTSKFLKVVTLTGLGLICLSLIFAKTPPDDTTVTVTFGQLGLLLALLGPFVLAPVAAGEQKLWAQTRANALTALTRLQPLESLTLLISTMRKETLPWRLSSPQAERIVYSAAAQALNTVLLQMSEADQEELAASTLLSLALILEEMAFWTAIQEEIAFRTYFLPLGVTLLKLLSKFGDTRIEKIVKEVAKNAPSYGLRTAAAEALPILRATLQIQETRKTLLRASDAGNISSETLLRAASESANIDPAQLLRAQTTQNHPSSEE